ncbi:MAG TPA: trypsin-like peptidase domain-containing protein [Actinoplanes sp.]
MNENETDPRRVDPPSTSSSPERGQSEEPTAAQPTVAGSPQWGPPVAGAPQEQPSAAPAQPGGPAAQHSAPPAPPSGPPAQQPGSPWQQPPQQPWQQGGYQQHPGYPQAGYQQYQPTTAFPAWSPAGGGQAPPPGEGQPWTPVEGPAWAAPVATDQRPRSGRGRKTIALGAAAVLIALLSGGVGAAAVLAFDDDGSPTSVRNANSSVTRVVDRSSLAEIAAAMQDSVVSITTGNGEGSGVVRSADGYIVTNNHVVATAQAGTVTVIFADGKKAEAKVVGTDPRTDLAVVKVSGVSDLKAATFGTSAKMQVGDTVLAIGSPLGLEGSVTAGIISAKDRTIQSSSQGEQSPFGSQEQQQQQQGVTTMSGLLQTDAPINPGNSGGALVNTNGEVIGINSAIATQGQSTGNIGVGFAIPSDKAKQVADDLMAGKKVSHPALGVSVTTAENGGALVSTVTPNSAAAKADLQQGDVITAVDGKEVAESDDVVAAVQAGAVGQKMTIDFTRDGAKKQVTVTLTEAQ